MSNLFREGPPAATSEPLAEARRAISRTLASVCGRPLGEILKISAGLTHEKLEEALATQAEKGGRIGEILAGMKVVSEEDVAKALAAQLDIPYLARIQTDAVDPELLKKVPINFAKQARILPLSLDGDAVLLAVADPLDTAALDHA